MVEHQPMEHVQAATAPQPQQKQINANQIGWLFVREYYTFLNESPERLHLFYNSNSTWTHGTEAETGHPVHGQQPIQREIAKLDYQSCQAFISSVDAQQSMSGGVIVQVLGELSNKEEECHKFSQTFFLAEQPEGYYVLNDIFRFLKEDIDVGMVGVETNGASATSSVFDQQQNHQNWDGNGEIASSGYTATPSPVVVEETPVFNYQGKQKKQPSPAKHQPQQSLQNGSGLADASAPVIAPVKKVAPAVAVAPKVAESAVKPVVEHTEPAHTIFKEEVRKAPVLVKAENDSSKLNVEAKQKASVAQPSKQQQSKAATSATPTSASASIQPPQPKTVPPPSGGVGLVKKARSQSPSKKVVNEQPPAAPTAWAKVVAPKNDGVSTLPVSLPQTQSHNVVTKKEPSQQQPKQKQPQQHQQQQQPREKEVHPSSEGFKEVQNRKHHSSNGRKEEFDNRPLPEKEKSTVCLRGLNKMGGEGGQGLPTKEAIMETFEVVGPVMTVDILPSKNLVFVTFKSPESAQSSVGRQFTIVGTNVVVTADERRKTAFGDQPSVGGGKSYNGAGFRRGGGGIRGGRGGRGGGAGNGNGGNNHQSSGGEAQK